MPLKCADVDGLSNPYPNRGLDAAMILLCDFRGGGAGFRVVRGSSDSPAFGENSIVLSGEPQLPRASGVADANAYKVHVGSCLPRAAAAAAGLVIWYVALIPPPGEYAVVGRRGDTAKPPAAGARGLASS